MQDTTQSNAAVQTSTDREVDPLAREVADLRAELEAMRAHVMGQNAGPEPDVTLGQREELSKRRLGRRRHNGSGEHSEPSGLVSRRRLFGLLGGAAAMGTGLAVAGSALGADPAGATAVTVGAADGDALQIGGSNTCTSTTTLTATGLNALAIQGSSSNGSGAGVVGNSGSGYGLVGSGGRAPLRLQPAGSVGAPTTGAHNAGEFVVDSNGTLFTCVVAGTPGTWVRQSPLVTLAAPHRVYDSRIGQPNQSPNVQGSITFTNPPPTAASRTINCAKDASSATTVVPSGATSLLMNLTVISISGVGALAVFPTGATQPSSSSINWSAGGQVLANGLTSACNTTQQVDVAIVASTGASTNFILDVIGYYL